LRYTTAYKIINIWNLCLLKLRDAQNKNDSWNYEIAPGFQYAQVSKHPGIQKLHNLITKNHNNILLEVKNLALSGYTGLPMNEIDSTQGETFKDGAKNWRPIWVKFLSIYAGTANKLPTLKQIVADMGTELILLHVSVFYAGVDLIPHRGITMGHYRYHYGLLIPEGDVALKINNSTYKWKTGEGIQFDDTHWHSAWNRTNTVRLVIFADVERQMPIYMKLINRLILRLIEYTAHIKSVKEKLLAQGIVKD
jgi:aspartyl/asparaginyl beta-hydroxylase (cupin superfamily)